MNNEPKPTKKVAARALSALAIGALVLGAISSLAMTSQAYAATGAETSPASPVLAYAGSGIESDGSLALASDYDYQYGGSQASGADYTQNGPTVPNLLLAVIGSLAVLGLGLYALDAYRGYRSESGL